MARRRINTRFLGVIFAVILVLAIGAVMARKFLHHENPQPYIVAGDAALKAGDWPKAAANLGKAVSLMPKDPRLLTEYGDALAQASPDDPDVMRKVLGAWHSAVDIDPDCKEAWLSLLNYYNRQMAVLEAQPGEHNRNDLSNLYTLARDNAAQLIRLDPKNP